MTPTYSVQYRHNGILRMRDGLGLDDAVSLAADMQRRPHLGVRDVIVIRDYPFVPGPPEAPWEQLVAPELGGEG